MELINEKGPGVRTVSGNSSTEQMKYGTYTWERTWGRERIGILLIFSFGTIIFRAFTFVPRGKICKMYPEFFLLENLILRQGLLISIK